MVSIVSLFRCIPAYIIYSSFPEKENVDKDIAAFNGRTFWKLMCCNSCFRSVFYARCNRYPNVLLKISKLLLRQKMDLQIEVIDGIGGGMTVYHGNSTIVYAKSIGNNFTVYQQVTIGKGKKINGNDVPILGDDVTVYAGAIIVGGIHIGNHAKIGAGAVVVTDVPDYATVVSAPTRIIENGREKTK